MNHAIKHSKRVHKCKCRSYFDTFFEKVRERERERERERARRT